MSQVTYKPPQTPVWRSALTWGLVIAGLVFVVVIARDLGSRMKSRDAIGAIGKLLYPENPALNIAIALAVILGALALTAFVGTQIGQRLYPRRRISYLAVLGDQLTHFFFWIVMLFSIYPVFYVVAASFDPLNRLVQSSLGADTEPFLLRARVVPSLEGMSLENYGKLFVGVVIYPWQLLLLLVALLGVLGLAALWVMTQLQQGTVTPAMRRMCLYATWLALVALGLFLLGLSPAQFTGTTNASKFGLWIRNTFIISSITAILTVALTTTTGYALARLRFPGRFQFLMFMIFIQMFPALLGFVAIFNLVASLGLLNSIPGIVLAYTGGAITFGTWIYKGYVESLPASLEEAALVDGCTRWTAFTRIVLPLSGPMLVFIFLLQFVGTYSEFFMANLILTGAPNWNVGLGLRSFATGQFNTEYGGFAAAAVLGSLPIVLLYYSFQQVFVTGALAGGEKG